MFKLKKSRCYFEQHFEIIRFHSRLFARYSDIFVVDIELAPLSEVVSQIYDVQFRDEKLLNYMMRSSFRTITRRSFRDLFRS